MEEIKNELETKEEVKTPAKPKAKAKEVKEEVLETPEDKQAALFERLITDMALSQSQQAEILKAMVDKSDKQGEILSTLSEAQLQKMIEDNPNFPGIRRESAANVKGESLVPVTVPRAYRDVLGSKYDFMFNCQTYRIYVDGKTQTMMPESVADYFLNNKLPRILDFHVEEESVDSRTI